VTKSILSGLVLVVFLLLPTAQAASRLPQPRVAYVQGDSIYTMNLDGSDQRLLHYGAWPAYSTDGRQIAYYSVRGGGLFLLDVASGRVLKRLTRGFDVQPAFAPDGRTLAFARNVPGAGLEIYTLRLFDGHLTRVTRNRLQDLDPAYSPNGRYLAFSRAGGASRTSALVVLSRTGGPPRTFPVGGQPAWAPDSSSLAFTTPLAHVGRISLLNPTVVTDLGEGYRPAFTTLGQLVFVSRSGDVQERPDIWRMNIDGSGRVRLTQTPPSDEPDFQPQPICDPCVSTGP
jgi:Tol biopolymer transport system component